MVENARVVDPSRKLDAEGHLVCEGGEIVSCEAGPAPEALLGENVEHVDARGLLLTPGLWDIHVALSRAGTGGRGNHRHR